jgi:hypothetical protein
MEKVRVLMAEGRTKQEICDEMGMHQRTLTRYENRIRERIIGDYDGKKVVDLFTAHKKRMEAIIQQCRVYLAMDPSVCPVAPEKLYRAIQSASESITDMGIKVGIVPTVAQRLSVDLEVKKDDEKLKELLKGHWDTIDSTIPKTDAPESQ